MSRRCEAAKKRLVDGLSLQPERERERCEMHPVYIYIANHYITYDILELICMIYIYIHMYYSHKIVVPIPVEDDTQGVSALSGAGAVYSTENYNF